MLYNSEIGIMNKRFKLTIVVSMLFLSINAFAGVLMQQWTDNTQRYCKYSDGEVVKVNFGSTCSTTN